MLYNNDNNNNIIQTETRTKFCTQLKHASNNIYICICIRMTFFSLYMKISKVIISVCFVEHFYYYFFNSFCYNTLYTLCLFTYFIKYHLGGKKRRKDLNYFIILSDKRTEMLIWPYTTQRVIRYRINSKISFIRIRVKSCY